MTSSRSQITSFSTREGNSWPIRSSRNRENTSQSMEAHRKSLRVLIVDRDSMSSDLLAEALTRDRDFAATAVESAVLLNRLAEEKINVVVLAAELNLGIRNGLELAQIVRRAHPSIPMVILLSHATQDSVINAFRSGARGVFSRQSPLAEFVSCVEHVCEGHIWAGSHETTLLLNAFTSMRTLEITIEDESLPLTARELEVVKCAAKGKTNKAIAKQLGLSEHTVKNYLFRAFEKLGVSNRVELLFCLTQKCQAFAQPDEALTRMVNGQPSQQRNDNDLSKPLRDPPHSIAHSTDHGTSDRKGLP